MRHNRNNFIVSDSAFESGAIPYDENLLERARVQWQFGDWLSLAKIERQALQHHPDRAKLALLACAGHLQLGNIEGARKFMQLALDWGCNRKLFTQILVAGVHNSLGRACAQSGKYSRALRHLEQSVHLGAGGGDTRLLVRARSSEQFMQLGLKVPENQDKKLPNNATNFEKLEIKETPKISPISVERFFSANQEGRQGSLSNFRECLIKKFVDEPIPDFACTCVSHRGKDFWFVHFLNDYIPLKMAERNQFYETAFLNLLARLYQPGKLIVDVGANIGNHTIFFAGVMNASVVAFEPQEHNYEILVANIYLNRLESKVDARKKALGECSRIVSLVQAIPDNYGSFTADLTQIPKSIDTSLSQEYADIQLTTLDTELDLYKKNVSIIKLDIEGMELHALRGAIEVISESLPVIAVECFTKLMYQKVKDFLSVFEYFVLDSTNATPTFIFLTNKNPHHLLMLTRYLEISSVGKFSSNATFNELK